MLGTLIKYEFKAVGRLLLPLYAAWFVAAVMLGLSISGDSDSPLFITLSGVLYGGVTVSAVVLTTIILIQRFYKNLLGSEGYLMFALPVTTGRHIANKVFSGAVWCIAGIAVAVLGGIAIAITVEGFSSFWNGFQFFIGDIKILLREEPTAILFAAELLIIALAGAAEFAAKVYAAIAVGHQWNNHRVLGAILAFIGFGVIETTLGNIVMQLSNYDLADLVFSLTDNLPIVAQMHVLMLLLILFEAAVTAIYWSICWKLLDSRLNLE